jgi:hypothetical protein
MSATKKLRAGNSELTKLKVLWRDSLAEDAKSYWQELFVSPDHTQAQIRQLIASKLKINLRFDKQLNAFRDWEMEQRQLELEEERQQEDERRFIEEFGSDNLDLIREKVLKKSYARSIAKGDFKSARATVVQDLNVEKVNLDKRKVAILEKKAAAFDQAKDVLTNKELSEEQRAQRMREVFGISK